MQTANFDVVRAVSANTKVDLWTYGQSRDSQPARATACTFHLGTGVCSSDQASTTDVGNRHPGKGGVSMSMTPSMTRGNRKKSKASEGVQMLGSREPTFFARQLPGGEGVLVSQGGPQVEGAEVITIGQATEAGAMTDQFTGTGEAVDLTGILLGNIAT